MPNDVFYLPITDCPTGAGSINIPGAPDPAGPVLPSPYIVPQICVGELDLNACDFADTYQETLAEENLNISGATVNVFKLLGNHEQGKLIDLIGNGKPFPGSANAFDALAPNYVSQQTGVNVLLNSYIGYDFGTVKTSYGQEAYAPGAPVLQHITSFRITQPTQNKRALQVRVDRSDGVFKVDPLKIQFSGAGNGSIFNFTPAVDQRPGTLMLTAIDSTNFECYFTSATTEVIGICSVGTRFNSPVGSFTIQPGTIPFAKDDMFSIPVELEWYRVDVLNLPDSPAPVLARIKQSSGSRFWRIVPLSFSGASSGNAWEVEKLELFDFAATRLDDVQDTLFQENRDRDYAPASVPIKASYTPFDSVSDLSKFGFQIGDVYTFTTTFGSMIRALGRPIVTGDVLEVPSEMQYDHNLKPIRKFLEVTDTGWAADGYTSSWKPTTFRFQASQLIPSQEHRDILGTVDTQKYAVDDFDFMNKAGQIQTNPLTATEANYAEAKEAVPEKGTNIREVASGTNIFGIPGSYDGIGLYVQDGLPPDGQAYTEGFKLPDVSTARDSDFFRLNYDPKTDIPSRLYKFNGVKNSWVYVETDMRKKRSSMKPSQLEIMNQPQIFDPKKGF